MTPTRADRLRIARLVVELNARIAYSRVRDWWEGGWFRQIMVGAAVFAAVECVIFLRIVEAVRERWS